MKIVSYKPTDITNVALFFNNIIEETTNEKYIMFIFDDLKNSIIDFNEFVTKYENLMSDFDLPYSFFPYYSSFNKILNTGIANPRAHIRIKDSGKLIDIISQPAYSMLIIDIEKIKSINFKFNEKYKIAFYVQDLIQKCFENKLFISNICFIDVFESYKMVKDISNEYMIQPNVFMIEKNEFFKENKIEQQPINKFIEDLKMKYGHHEEVQPNNSIEVVNDSVDSNKEEHIISGDNGEKTE